MTQPEALRLADALRDGVPYDEAEIENELRRLHQFAEDQIGRATAAEAALQMTKATHALKIAAVETQRDALLKALNAMLADKQSYELGLLHGAAAEREACAKVCDFEVARLTAIDEPRAALAVGICAAAIRARGQA